MDNLSPSERSIRMSKIRSKNTVPEMTVRKLVFRMGYRYRLHGLGLPGSPDMVFKSRKKVIFVHGCFWHGHENCKIANRPKSRTEYWNEKFAKNKARDSKNENDLRRLGWDVLIIWECELKDKFALSEKIKNFLNSIQK